MQFESSIFVLVAIAVVCNCQEEEPTKSCCFLSQYEAVYGGNVGYYHNGTPGSLAEGYQFAVDVDGGRVGSEGYQVTSGYNLSFKTIQLFKQGKQFTIMNDVCTVTPISATAAPQKCLPPTAKFMGHMTQGLDEMWLSSYQMDLSSESMKGTFFSTVSAKTCSPVGASFSGVIESQGDETSVLTNGGYFNATKGISNPDRWFTVPSSCTTADPKLKVSGEQKNIIDSIMETLIKERHPFF